MSKRELFIKTEKQLISTLPRFLYEGPIYVIQSEAEAKRAIKVLQNADVVGIDTETRPSFRKGVTHRVALLQLSTREVCFLFRLNVMGFPPCLIDYLANPLTIKVGLSLKDDFMMLRQRKDFKPDGFIDLQKYVAEMGIQDMSLQKLYANVFRQKISKNARLTNWEADALTEAQQRYAATDAYACIMLYDELHNLRESKEYILIPAKEAP